jgi:hypothetical protein
VLCLGFGQVQDLLKFGQAQDLPLQIN